MRWLPRFALLLVGVWLTGVGWFVLTHWLGSMRPVVDVAAAPADGPMIVRGRASGTPRGQPPSGIGAAAWSVWVSELSPYGRPLAKCVELDADDLHITDGAATLRVDPSLLPPDSDVRFFSVLGSPPPTKTIPVEFAARCPASRAAGAEYHEAVIPSDATIFVSACRVGDQLIPCNDHSDRIASKPFTSDSLGDRRRHDVGPFVMRLVVWTAGFLGLAGLLLWRARRLRRLGDRAHD